MTDKCANKVRSAFESRIEDIRLMLDPKESDVTLLDDGSLDTVLAIGDEEFRFETFPEYRNDETGELNLEQFIEDHFDDMAEAMRERFYEYGLSFDYVAPNTFNDQPEGYIRYQLSWGGPSEEFRFYVSPSCNEYDNPYYRAEFWYLDWFGGACVDVTSDKTVSMLYEWFDSCGSVSHAINGAA